MKKSIILISSVIGLLLSGCGAPLEPGVEKGEKFDIIPSSEKGVYYLSDKSEINTIKKSTSLSQDKRALKRELRIVAKTTKKKGYNYFIILNRDMNNANGFPINNVNDLHRYISLKKRNGDYFTNGTIQGQKGILSYNRVKIKFKPVSSKVLDTYISAWSVGQTLKDTQ